MLVGMLCGCTMDKQCRVTYKVEMQALFNTYAVGADSTYVTYERFDSVTVQGVGNDSILYNNAKSVAKLYLPFRPDTTVTAYSIIYHDKPDTLYIKHDNTVQFISLACGEVVFHTIESVWAAGTWIDSVVVLDPTVEVNGKENIRIVTHENN